ncbi:hypothetical protein SAMN06297129_1683 [Pseudooceanicola antarcticus]|uniref:HdeA/HdeB family protein n=1 Tax=Pseudooceanicola antarcticus TaxID=1247613 RepID=A0A285ISL9_9RHOB|nr:hypothetical protein [Pseudooceanicola antarcticus]PJE31411.1 hypothetical protein CVM39_03390 [Pseudooceanicola antarcticus]SNY50096.1 hypothetical protein SAMN06297129_1683 [Pseudooceanicola antarcticus]
MSFRLKFFMAVRGLVALVPTISMIVPVSATAQAGDTVESLTNFILSSDEPDEVETAFCDLMNLDADAAAGVAESYSANNSDVDGVDLGGCSTGPKAQIFII